MLAGREETPKTVQDENKKSLRAKKILFYKSMFYEKDNV